MMINPELLVITANDHLDRLRQEATVEQALNSQEAAPTFKYSSPATGKRPTPFGPGLKDSRAQ
ncbi:hypothetical protein [uncultured Meiothermus sp.]|jgi:hypothetical protein|uniref:hypothetical protein n=1 Tax=uncultured Meiothermus sp. TaxID=157471 RepID=UPI0026320DF4|nr:hypothetical protein [uncultured Meiothermus sp.]